MKRFALLSLFLLTAPAAGDVLDIKEDTYVDNQVVGSASNIRTNYGGNPAMKAVSNLNSGTSLVHGLFKLPTVFWNNVGASPVTSPVTLTFNIRNNSLATTDTTNPTAVLYKFRQLDLHPMQQAFTVGTGGAGSTSTSAGAVNGTLVNGVPTYYGADWATSDGITPWANQADGSSGVGGKFDANFSLFTDPKITSAAQTTATWDITALLNNPTARSEMFNFGLYVRVTDETTYTRNEFASMVSYESGQDTSGSFAGLGPKISFTTVPEPTALAMIGLGGLLATRRRRTA